MNSRTLLIEKVKNSKTNSFRALYIGKIILKIVIINWVFSGSIKWKQPEMDFR